VAVLALSLAAKLADWEETTVAWPVNGVPRTVAGPAQATVVEGLVVVAALVPLPVTVRLGLVGGLFAVYAVATLLLRGRRCACFGGWLPTRFTLAHAAGCAAAVALTVAAILGAPGLPGAWSASTQAAIGLVIAVVAAGVFRYRAAAARPAVVGDVERIVIFTAESCRYCAALEAQRDRYEAMTDRPVEFRRAVSEEDAAAAGGGFPAAVAYGPDGVPVGEPAHGLAGIRDLLRRSATGLRRTESQVTT
jgi:hypothetical protein